MPTCPIRCACPVPTTRRLCGSSPSSIDRLEHWCDQFGDPLPALKSFILPGGSLAAAQLHVARTVARRAERAAWVAAAEYGTEPVADPETPGGVNPLAITYLNRLSDLLFILTRAVNGADGDVLWVPGRDREPRLEELIMKEATGAAQAKQAAAGDLVHRAVGGPAVHRGVPTGVGVGLRRAGDRLLG